MPLTTKQLDILRRLAAGDSNKKIATDLRLGLRTVESYLYQASKELGISATPEANMRVQLAKYWGDWCEKSSLQVSRKVSV